MGFSSLLDILGSTIIGALLFMILLRMNDAATQNSYTFSGEAQVQMNLVSVVQLLEYDLKKIGYCKDIDKIADPTKAIIAADSTSIKFLTDISPADGVVDTLRYFLGSENDMRDTPNPHDKMLYRVVNNAVPKGSNLGITTFKIIYFNTLGDQIPFPITQPSEIYTMQIDVKVENTAAYDQQYSSAFWRQIRLAARNIKNR